MYVLYLRTHPMDDCTHCASVCCAMYSCVVTVVCSVVVFLVLLGLSDLLDCQTFATYWTARPGRCTGRPGLGSSLAEWLPGLRHSPETVILQKIGTPSGVPSGRVCGGAALPPPTPTFFENMSVNWYKIDISRFLKIKWSVNLEFMAVTSYLTIYCQVTFTFIKLY